MELITPFIEILGLHFINDPKDRIYFGYILSAALIAGFFYFFHFQSFSIKKFLLYFFNPKVLFHTSSRIDIYLFIFNYWLRIFLIMPLIFSEVKIINQIQSSLGWIMPTYTPIPLNPLLYSIIYTVIFFLVADFFRFFLHYLSHKIPFLWELHKVHHSASVMTPLTTYRVHPIEVFILIVKQILVTGFVAGVFSFFIAGEYAMLTIFGVQMIDFIINSLGINLRHSHVPLSFGKKLESVLISPIMHQMHHAINKNNNLVNLGSCFSFWDILFNTFQRPDFKPMRFGLPKDQRKKKIYNIIINPFIYFQWKQQKAKIKTQQKLAKQSIARSDDSPKSCVST